MADPSPHTVEKNVSVLCQLQVTNRSAIDLHLVSKISSREATLSRAIILYLRGLPIAVRQRKLLMFDHAPLLNIGPRVLTPETTFDLGRHNSIRLHSIHLSSNFI